MNRRRFPVLIIAACAAIAGAALSQEKKEPRTSPLGYEDTPYLPGQKWRVHDLKRPRPRMVTPGREPGAPPSDAVVLFDGKDLSKWVNRRRGRTSEPAWKIENGYVEIVPGTGDLVTKDKFGDAQYHLEFSIPTGSYDSSQWKGNSGVLIQNRYEIQVLESFANPTYADGQAGSIYGQWPPLVNASRPEGQWNVYDIVFEAPRWEGDKLVKPAFATVFHNGIVVHNRKEITGRMAHRIVGTYAPHGLEEPLALQDHDVPVRYRNMWVRPLTGYDQE